MIEEILPMGVSCAEALADSPDATLFPDEAAIVAKAVDKRRLEFTTGRSCARRALSQLGVAPVSVLTGDGGAPLWPPGIVGSITHCLGYRAAAVALATDFAALGLDAEPDDRLPDGVLQAVSLAEERFRLRTIADASPGISWDRILFSAKESVYKTWFPLTRTWLGFDEANVTIDAADGTFRAELLAPGLLPSGRLLADLNGRWLVRRGLVFTAITLPTV